MGQGRLHSLLLWRIQSHSSPVFHIKLIICPKNSIFYIDPIIFQNRGYFQIFWYSDHSFRTLSKFCTHIKCTRKFRSSIFWMEFHKTQSTSFNVLRWLQAMTLAETWNTSSSYVFLQSAGPCKNQFQTGVFLGLYFACVG